VYVYVYVCVFVYDLHVSVVANVAVDPVEHENGQVVVHVQE
jgi:hypothetical protein